MKLPKTILRGYDHVTERYVANALGINLDDHKEKKKHRKFRVRHLKKKRGRNNNE